MQFNGQEYLEIFATFVEGQRMKYIRMKPFNTPIWYQATPNGFSLLSDQILYTGLENEYQQQESKKQRDSTKIHPFASERPEGTKLN